MIPVSGLPDGKGRCPLRGAAVRLALVLGPLLLAAACAAPPPAPAPGAPHDSPAVGPRALESRALSLVNGHRRSAGLPPLAADGRIAAVARRHSEAMAAGRIPFGHDGFDARAEEIARMMPMGEMAENVGLNDYPPSRSAEAAVSGWLGSRGHRKNIEGRYDLTGVGIARSARGTYYYTQIFVRRR